MTKKYVVKNCPNLSYAIMADGTERNFQCGLEIDVYCKDCTNCLVKQIIERCKDSVDYHSKDMYILGRTNMAGIVLALLHIEEVE